MSIASEVIILRRRAADQFRQVVWSDFTHTRSDEA